MDERPQRCETCRFWDQADGECGKGNCRRHPPLPAVLLNILYAAANIVIVRSDDVGMVIGDHDASLWPWTGPDDWCGEWKPLPEATP